MDTRRTTTHGIWRLLVTGIAALPLVMTLGAAPVSAASPTACRVQNADSGKTFTALQSAVDAAKGDRLTVRAPAIGNTVIDRSLAIKGVLAPGSGKPILDGGKGHVLRIKPAARVTIRGLVIQGGVADRVNKQGVNHPGRGAGVLNRGTLRLVGVVVRRNAAWEGAGIYNAGVLRLRGATKVRDNVSYPTAPLSRHWGVAGLYNTGIATLGDASSIRDNSGIGVSNSGTVTLNDRSSIRDNPEAGVSNSGTLALHDRSSISRNGCCGFSVGGGVSTTGTVTMSGWSAIPFECVRGRCHRRERWVTHPRRRQCHPGEQVLLQRRRCGRLAWWVHHPQRLQRGGRQHG